MPDVIESQCQCGQPFLIEQSGNPTRRDGKRVYYPDRPEGRYDVFRCKSCLQPVNETVPGAEHEKP